MEDSIITDRDVVLSGSNLYIYGDGFTVCNMFFYCKLLVMGYVKTDKKIKEFMLKEKKPMCLHYHYFECIDFTHK